MNVQDIFKLLKNNEIELTRDKILQLLSINNLTEEFYKLISLSNDYTRNVLHNQGYVFVQIGLNTEPCSGNCLFCSMGADHFSVNNRWRKNPEQVAKIFNNLDLDLVDDVFLMTTADYPLKNYLKVVEKVKPLLNSRVRLVANIADFNPEEAKLLKQAGVTGAYHVNRLREGIDTSISVQTRLKTLDAIKDSGLELYYCIEPIGAEHSYEEILTEILRARDLQPEVMAVMRRVNYPNSPLSNRRMISAIELTKIAAVTNLVVRPTRAMNLHETEPMSLLAGVNQLYAEIGANPRDTYSQTECSRGISVELARKMLRDSSFNLKN